MKSKSIVVKKSHKISIVVYIVAAFAVFIGVTIMLVMLPRKEVPMPCVSIKGVSVINGNCNPIKVAICRGVDLSIYGNGKCDNEVVTVSSQNHGWPMKAYATYDNVSEIDDISLVGLFVDAIPGFMLGVLIVAAATNTLHKKYKESGQPKKDARASKNKSSRK